MLKKLFLSSILSLSLSAGVLNGVSILVNGEPITLYEVAVATQKMKLSQRETIEFLVQKKLEDIEVAKLGIGVDKFELDRKIEEIAKQNGITTTQMREIIEQKFLSWEDYRDDIKEQLIKEKLFKSITLSKFNQIDEEEVEVYYNANKDKFSIPKVVKVIEVSSSSKELVSQAISNPMASINGVERVSKELKTDNMNPQVLFLLNETDERDFTPIIQNGDKFVSLYVEEKLDLEPLKFDIAKQMAFSKVAKMKEQQVIKNYFDKLKAKAVVKIVRLPAELKEK